VRYFTDLPGGFVPGCMVTSRRSLARLSAHDRGALQRASERIAQRFERVGLELDAQLLAHGFARQGLVDVPMSASFRREWFEAAHAASERLGPRLVPKELVRRVAAILEEHRRWTSERSP
jgi:hypothetical protein